MCLFCLMRQNKINGFIWADQNWNGLMIFKNFAKQDWIGFNFCGSGLDSDWKISQSAHLRWPEALFQTPTPLLFQNFGIRVRQFFKFENPTPVQTPATIINPTLIYPRFYLRNDLTDSCYCRNWKVTLDPGPIFHKFLAPGPKEKRRILPESTPVTRICCKVEVSGYLFFNSWSISDKFFEYPYPILIQKFLKFSIRYPFECDTGQIQNKQAVVIGPPVDLHFWKLIHPLPVTWHYSMTSVQ